METTGKYLPVAGRFFLSLIFIMSGLSKIGGWEQTIQYMASKGMPMTSSFLFGAIFLEIGGGLSLLLGFRAKIGAIALIVFLIPATFIFHNFWSYEGMEQQTQMIMFMKNLSIMGGLILILGFGSGPLSFDNRTASQEAQ